MNKLELGLYALVIMMWLPSIGSVYFTQTNCTTVGANGQVGCFMDFWDFHQSTFMVISIAAFIPMGILSQQMAKRSDNWLIPSAFITTGFWFLLLAIPDWIIGNLAPEYQEIPFADGSIGMFVFNLTLYYISWKRGRTPSKP